MRTSYIVGLLVVIVIVFVAFAFYNGSPSDTDLGMNEENATSSQETEMESESDSDSESSQSENTDTDTTDTENDENMEDEAESDAGVTVVTYTSAGFEPETVTVNVGDTVRFVNESDRAIWPASDVHPTHTEYSGTSLQEHCGDGRNESFDACGEIQVGADYSFTFTKEGTWEYHDHLRSGETGTVVVE